MRSIAATAVFCLLLAGCSKSGPVAESVPKAGQGDPASKDEPLKKYELRGEVQRIDAQGHLATIKHEAIGDWMGAMTMEFPVKDDADFAKLKAGQPVQATVYVQGFSYWVADVK
jgi:Cu/Ag efflux protein CusF